MSTVQQLPGQAEAALASGQAAAPSAEQPAGALIGRRNRSSRYISRTH